MKINNRHATLNGLKRLGWVADSSKMTKYVVHVHMDSQRQWLVGKSGALRSRNGTGTGISMTDSRCHKALQEIGRRARNFSSDEQAQAEFEYLQR